MGRIFWALYGLALLSAVAYIVWASSASMWAGGYAEFLPRRG